jgi:hypothetical protein
VKTYLDSEAKKLTKTWLDKYRVTIKDLSDERQEAYRQIREMSADPEYIDLARPKSWLENTSAREVDGSETPLPTYKRHLLCDESGLFPAEMNDWEAKVLRTEMERNGFLAWYRNPSRSSQDSLGVAYVDDNKVKIVRPDFIFFSKQPGGSIAADIVDPHGTYLADALPKLKGLARYAETHQGVFRRIESTVKVGDVLRVLDLKNAAVRKAVEEATDAKSLYDGRFASNYQ